MSAFRPRKTKTGGLPNISFLIRKPEPLGTELKDTGDMVIECIKALELQMGKERMRKEKYSAELGATAACTLRLAEEGQQPLEAGQKQGLIGDAWFGSVLCADELGQKNYKAILSVSVSKKHTNLTCINTVYHILQFNASY